METNHLKEINMQDVAAELGLIIAAKSNNNVRYRDPHIEDKSGNWNLQISKNKIKDFSNSNGTMNTIDVVMAVKQCNFIAAVEFLQNISGSPQPQNQNIKQQPKKFYTLHSSKPYELGKFTHHDNYWSERGLISQIHQLHLVVLKTENGKYLHYSGFKTGVDSFELRMPKTERNPKAAKICFGTKAVTIIEGGNRAAVYEGFTDYLTHRDWYFQKQLKYPFTGFILNSVALVSTALQHFDGYKEINMYLDNDIAGNDATNIIKKEYPYATDMRKCYAKFEDLNAWHIARLKK